MQTQVTEATISIRQQKMPATLTLPRDADQVQAGIVYVHGSGDGTEDEVTVEAERFASMGIAFLTVKKVMEGYTRTKRDYSLLADDAIEAVEWLRKRPELQGVPTGLMGFSEGGWVAPLAAASRQDVIDFLVLESAAIVTPGEQIRFHRAAETRSLPLYRRIFARLYTEFAVLACNYSRFDSRPHLQTITRPIYAVWGSDDHTIPVDRATSLLRKYTSVHPSVVVIEGDPHYLDPEGDWLNDVADWVRALPRR